MTARDGVVTEPVVSAEARARAAEWWAETKAARGHPPETVVADVNRALRASRGIGGDPGERLAATAVDP